MECCKDLTEMSNLILFFGVLGTWAIAVLAIWGNPIRSMLAGPKLELKLHNAKGEMTTNMDGLSLRYYHLDVINNRKTAKAVNACVQVNKLLWPLADGSFKDENLSTPLQLQWQFPKHNPQFLTIGYKKEVCDLGFVPRGGPFRLTSYLIPKKYEHMITLGSLQKFRVEIVAVAENTESNKLNLEISWDGEWSDDSDEMSKHLVVTERKSCV